MPRTKASARRGARQNTLSFSNKITKASGVHSTKTDKTSEVKASKLLNESDVASISTTSPAPEDSVPKNVENEVATTSDLVIRQQAQSESVSAPLDEQDGKALKISDTQIKKYWKGKETIRKAARVHQQDLSVYDKILREFDQSSQYGPCIGIARTKRWKRANRLSLNPPIEVLAVLLKETEKDDTKAQRAYVDELLESRHLS